MASGRRRNRNYSRRTHVARRLGRAPGTRLRQIPGSFCQGTRPAGRCWPADCYSDCGLDRHYRELAASVAARIQSRWGLPRKSILFNASHTHSAPEVRPERVPFFEIPPEFAAKIPPYVLSLEEKMVGVIEAALKNLEPVALQAAEASAAFAHNRRTSAGPVAHDVPVLQILRPDKTPLAILFGYACHNLTLPPSFCRYHGDYAGVAQQALEQTYPGAKALFLAGAGADLDPAPRGTVELTFEHGHALAKAVGQTFLQPALSVEGPLRAAFREVALDFAPLPAPEVLEADLRSNDPPRVRKANYLLAAQAGNSPLPASYPCPVQVFRFGNDLLLLALGGEPVVDYAARLKTEFAGPLVWVAGYSNDMFGYLPSRRVQREGGYEGGRALLWSPLPGPFTETVEERIFAAILDMARQNR